jgi:hypothetical protein
VHEEEALSVEDNRTNKREGWPVCHAPPASIADDHVSGMSKQHYVMEHLTQEHMSHEHQLLSAGQTLARAGCASYR